MHFSSYLDEFLLEGEIIRQNCIENQNTHFYVQRPFTENHAICERVGKNILEPDRLQLWCMRITGWISTATNTRTHNV